MTEQAKATGSETPVTPQVDPHIVRFIRRHHVLTLATSGDQGPYCSNAFYAYDAQRNLFLFSADAETLHAQHMERDAHVAASVVLETRIIGRLQGLQLCGTARRADAEGRKIYLKRFPYAMAMELTLWAVQPTFFKYTDNTLGFGKKLIWNA